MVEKIARLGIYGNDHHKSGTVGIVCPQTPHHRLRLQPRRTDKAPVTYHLLGKPVTPHKQSAASAGVYLVKQHTDRVGMTVVC